MRLKGWKQGQKPFAQETSNGKAEQVQAEAKNSRLMRKLIVG